MYSIIVWTVEKLSPLPLFHSCALLEPFVITSGAYMIWVLLELYSSTDSWTVRRFPWAPESALPQDELLFCLKLAGHIGVHWASFPLCTSSSQWGEKVTRDILLGPWESCNNLCKSLLYIKEGRGYWNHQGFLKEELGSGLMGVARKWGWEQAVQPD